jgi:hypothetical protein
MTKAIIYSFCYPSSIQVYFAANSWLYAHKLQHMQYLLLTRLEYPIKNAAPGTPVNKQPGLPTTKRVFAI